MYVVQSDSNYTFEFIAVTENFQQIFGNLQIVFTVKLSDILSRINIFTYNYDTNIQIS